MTEPAGQHDERPRLVRIPRHLLHVELGDLAGLGVPTTARDALRALMADLPLVPDASQSAQLVGPPAITLACLAVLARHVGQGLRDHNLSMAHNRSTLHTERRKLIFLEGDSLAGILATGDQRPMTEAVLFLIDTGPSREIDPRPSRQLDTRPSRQIAPRPSLQILLAAREAAGLATFVTSPTAHPHLAHWRSVDLSTPTQ
jgi:hypothetical protein